MKNNLLATLLSLTALLSIQTAAYSRIKTDDLLTENIQYPQTSNIQILKEAFEVKSVPSGSMETTLHGTPNTWEADGILIDKLIYRFQSPLRGDIIVFEPTDQLLRQQYQDAFIKRIIALPGEKVQLKNGKVYINNKPLQENKYISDKEVTTTDVCVSQAQPPYLDKPQIIPPNSYLVMGDNRQQSYDGRCWGVIPKKNILGQVVKRVWPLEQKREFGETRSSQQRDSEELFLKNVGFLVEPHDNLSSAISYFEKNLAIAKKNKNVINQIISLRSLIVYSRMNMKNNRAIDYSQQLLMISQKNKILGAETEALRLLTFNYFDNKDFDSSIYYGQQTLLVAQKNQDYHNQFRVLFILAIANARKSNCEKANEFYEQSLDVLTKLGNREKQWADDSKLLFLIEEIQIC